MQLGKGGGKLLCAPNGTSLHWKVSLYAPEGHEVWMHHTLAYVRALQHWVKETQPPVPSQPHHLVGSILKMWWAMDPLVTFAEGDVFVTTVLSRWTEITSPLSMKAAPPESPRSHCYSIRAHPRGSLPGTHSGGWPAPTTVQAMTEAEVPTTSPWKFICHSS